MSPIPPTAHFIWFGSSFPWVNQLAIRSASKRGGFQKLVLHHDGSLAPTVLDELGTIDGFEHRRIDAGSLFAAAHSAGPSLYGLFQSLSKPNAKANMIRAALLATEGGVYLDQDTITVRSLEPLLEQPAFCGEESIAWPASVKQSRNPARIARALALDGLRASCTVLPGGWRTFRRIERWYPKAVNNAVLGARPGHPFFETLLDNMLKLAPDRVRVPFALGTHLLQQTLATWSGEKISVLAPPAFYPLGPVVSQHWFKKAPAPALNQMLRPETYVVHWYASVENKALVQRIDEAYVHKAASWQPFAQLALRILG